MEARMGRAESKHELLLDEISSAAIRRTDLILVTGGDTLHKEPLPSNLCDFCAFADITYIEFSCSSDLPRFARYIRRYNWVASALQYVSEFGSNAPIRKVLWCDYDILWTGPAYSALDKFFIEILYRPFDVLFLSGYPSHSKEGALAESFLLTGFIAASQHGADVLLNVFRYMTHAAGIHQGFCLVDQRLMPHAISNVFPSSCATIIDDRLKWCPNYREWSGQMFVHFNGTSDRGATMKKWRKFLRLDYD
ncbi:MAG: hypothetical protein RML36_15370 [Anaerolineae bacterium]|nr:hypothetical protein [Anaerolineae bacterium]